AARMAIEHARLRCRLSAPRIELLPPTGQRNTVDRAYSGERHKPTRSGTRARAPALTGSATVWSDRRPVDGRPSCGRINAETGPRHAGLGHRRGRTGVA